MSALVADAGEPRWLSNSLAEPLMRSLVVRIVTATFILVAAAHLYWAAGGRAAKGATIPSRDGRPVFSPSRVGTLGVAVALLIAAGVVASAGRVMISPFPEAITSGFALVLALTFALRAVGDFRLVGFFKSAGEGRFARLDTFVYSPTCLILALLIVWIIWTG